MKQKNVIIEIKSGKNMLRVFAVLLLININLFSQDFLKLYRSEIPDQILADAVISKSLDINLRRNVSLNPELIYFTLKYYKQYDGKQFDTRLFEELKKNERVWLSKRSDWANVLISKIDSTENHDIMVNTEKFLDELIIDFSKKETDNFTVLNTDESNYRDYLILKYYNNNPDLKFDEKTNYTILRNQIEESKKQYFRQVKDNPSLISSPGEIVDNVIDNWYLLLDDTNLEASKLLIKCLDDVLLDKGRKKYSVFVGGVFINNTIDFNEKFNFPGIDYTVNLNRQTTLSQVFLGVGYKLYFNKKSYFMSYIDIQAYYSKGVSYIKDEQPVAFTKSEVTSTYTIDQILRNFNDSYKLSSLNSYGVKLSFPFYEYDFMTFEGAVSFTQNDYVFTPDMHFTYSKYKTNYGPPVTRETLSLGAQTFSEKMTKKYFCVIPMLEANLKIDSQFGMKFSAGYNYLAMSVYFATPLFY